MEQPPANSLVVALATGQPGSFAALYDQLGSPLLRVAGVMLCDSCEAEDAVQDMFVEFARRPDRSAVKCVFFLSNLTAEPAEAGMPANTYPPTGNGTRQVFYRIFVLNPDGYIHLMERLQNLSLLPYYQAIPKLAQDTSAKADSIFTSIIAPVLPSEFKGCARGEAETACVQVAIALTRFRLDRGVLPTGISELVPNYLDEVPIDPFDGRALRLVRKEKEMIIYSVGPDGVDDGGKAMDDQQKGDVTFRLPL